MAISLKKGESLDYSKGEQIWDYVYNKDAARAFFAIRIIPVIDQRIPQIFSASYSRFRLPQIYFPFLHNTVKYYIKSHTPLQ